MLPFAATKCSGRTSWNEAPKIVPKSNRDQNPRVGASSITETIAIDIRVQQRDNRDALETCGFGQPLLFLAQADGEFGPM
jgi:hypothetical protein